MKPPGVQRWAAPAGSPLPFQIRLACRTLTFVDGFVDGIGFGLMVVGVVIFAIGLAVRSNYVRQCPESGRAAPLVSEPGHLPAGGSLELLGIMVAARLAWPVLIVIAVFAAVGVVLLRARVGWW